MKKQEKSLHLDVDDYEREAQKDIMFMEEREIEDWLWWHEQRRMEEGIIIVDGVEELEELPF